MRLFLMMALVMIGGCTWLRGDATPEEPPVIVELTPPEKTNASFGNDAMDALPEFEAQPVYQNMVEPKPYYPLMKGFRVDKSVAVYPLDDWQPHHYSK